MAEFKDRVKELRQAKGALQKDIAEFLGISIRAYQHYETGTRFPDFEGINKLADYFGVTTDYLLGRTNYWQDAEGHITVKVPPDIFSDEEKQRIIKRSSKPR